MATKPGGAAASTVTLPVREGEEPWTAEEVEEVRTELVDEVEITVVHEIAHHFGIARGLIDRNEGVQAREFGPGDRHHLGGCVQLHGAAT